MRHLVWSQGPHFYLAFVADAARSDRGLSEIADALRRGPDWDQFRFLTTPTISSNRRTPLTALVHGEFRGALDPAVGRVDDWVGLDRIGKMGSC